MNNNNNNNKIILTEDLNSKKEKNIKKLYAHPNLTNLGKMQSITLGSKTGPSDDNGEPHVY